jgi:hypothetical protein
MDGRRAAPPEHAEPSWLLSQPTLDRQIGPDNSPDPAAAFRLSARYSRHYLAHASIGPSCALALFRDGRLDVWSHSQGVGPLGASIARVLGLAPETVVVHHSQGAGATGITGRMTSRLTRPSWRMRGRHPDPGPVDARGRAVLLPVRGRHRDRDRGRVRRGRPRARLDAERDEPDPCQPARRERRDPPAVAEALDPPFPRPAGKDFPDERGGGATRNTLALYDLPPQRIVHRLVPRLPIRTSALRGLGTLGNVFAIESAIDEIALQANATPSRTGSP